MDGLADCFFGRECGMTCHSPIATCSTNVSESWGDGANAGVKLTAWWSPVMLGEALFTAFDRAGDGALFGRWPTEGERDRSSRLRGDGADIPYPHTATEAEATASGADRFVDIKPHGKAGRSRASTSFSISEKQSHLRVWVGNAYPITRKVPDH